MKNLNEKIDLVLREELRNYETTGCLASGILGSFNIHKGDGWVLAGQERILIIETPSNNHLRSKKADLLLKLYSSLGMANREDLFLS